MKKLLLCLLCLGMCFSISGCSNEFTYDDAKIQAEEVVERLNTYNIGKFTLLTTNQENSDDGNYYYNCNIKYTSLDNSDIDLTLTLIDNQVSMLGLENKKFFRYDRIFNQYYEFYNKIINDSEYFNIKDTSNDKTIAFADFLDDQLEDIGEKETGSFSLNNGNTLLNFSYTKITDDNIWMQLIIN